MEKVIEELRYYNEKFPHAALEKAINNREETTQMLLKELDQMLEQPRIITEDYMLHTYTVFLLAQFREKEAFPKIIELVSVESDEVEFMFGDIITEDLNSILYSTFDGDFERLRNVIKNPMLNIYVRGAVLKVYGKLYADGAVSQEEFVNYLRELLAIHSPNSETDLANAIQEIAIDRQLFEMIDDVQQLYDEGRIDEALVGQYDSFIDYMYTSSFQREFVYYIDDIAQEMSGWPMFEQAKEDQLKEERDIAELRKQLEKMKRPEQRAQKIGRNDPCPCGSGKKYKKCCLKKDQLFKMKGQEPLELQERWLEDYPSVEGERDEHEVRITDFFDEESIEIDRLVYLALHHRPIPLWEERDIEKEERTKIAYLVDALDRFEKKYTQENIQTFEEYDSQYKIHYRSQDWLETLKELLERNDLTSKYRQVSEGLNETMKELA